MLTTLSYLVKLPLSNDSCQRSRIIDFICILHIFEIVTKLAENY